MFLCKLDDNGNLIWLKNGNISLVGQGLSIIFNDKNEPLIAGTFKNNMNYGSISFSGSLGDAFFIKLNTNGDPIWGVHTLQQSNGGKAGAKSLAFYNNDYYAVGYFDGMTGFGDTVYNGLFNDIFISKISDNNITGIIPKKKQLIYEIFPNPSDGIFHITYISEENTSIEIIVTDTKGRTIYRQSLQTSLGRFTRALDLGKEAKGVYFVEVIADEKRQVKKVILE